MKNRFEDIKAGWFVEIMHGDWVKVRYPRDEDFIMCDLPNFCGHLFTRFAVTDIRAPEEQAQAQAEPAECWLTEEECVRAWNLCQYPDGDGFHDELNALLTRKLAEGKLPVVAKENVARCLWWRNQEYIIPYFDKKPYENLADLGITPDLLNEKGRDDE